MKMLALEPPFLNTLLPAVFHGDSAIHRLTPFSAAVAFARKPRQEYQLPTSIRCIVPELLLAAPADSEVIDELAPDEDDDRPF